MDIFYRTDVKTASRLNRNEKLVFLVYLARYYRLLLVSATHLPNNCKRALSASYVVFLNKLVRIFAYFPALYESVVLELRFEVSFKHHVFFEGIVEYKTVLMSVLGDVAHLTLVALSHLRVHKVVSAQLYLSARGFFKSRQRIDKLRLSVPVDSGNTAYLARAYIERHILHRLALAYS